MTISGHTARNKCLLEILYGATKDDMRVVESLPREFERFEQIGGAPHFAVYEDAGEDETEALVAITSTIPDLDTDTLKSLGCKRIDKRSFFGDWYDAGTDSVLRIGEFTMSDGKKLINPRLKDLEGIHIRSGGKPTSRGGRRRAICICFFVDSLWAPSRSSAGAGTLHRGHELCSSPKSRAPHPGLEQPTLAGGFKILRCRHGVVGSVPIYSPCTCDQTADGDCRIHVRLSTRSRRLNAFALTPRADITSIGERRITSSTEQQLVAFSPCEPRSSQHGSY
jgi:hypothetical protein